MATKTRKEYPLIGVSKELPVADLPTNGSVIAKIKFLMEVNSSKKVTNDIYEETTGSVLRVWKTVNPLIPLVDARYVNRKMKALYKQYMYCIKKIDKQIFLDPFFQNVSFSD